MIRPNLDQIVAELEKARKVATIKGNASAMVSATMAKAKLLGLDKGEARQAENNIKVELLDKKEFEKIAKDLLQKI